MKKLLLFLLMFSFIQSIGLNPTTIKLEITGIRSETGTLRLGLYNKKSSWDNQKTDKEIQINKSELKNGKIVYELMLNEGEWGISLLDDENNNKKMDYNFIGIPKEGFGFSNYYHTGLSMPDFKNFAFENISGKSKVVVIKVKYM